MNLERLFPAVDRVREYRYAAASSEASALRAYPAMLAAARMQARDPSEAFLRAAALAHAWMSRPIRLDDAFLVQAIAAYELATADGVTISEAVIQPIADCLGSLIGASKLLHLGNPAVFPLWDKGVERFRNREQPSSYHMGQTRNYLAFIEDMWSLTSDPHFLTFHHDYCTAYQERLRRLNIAPYPLTEPRVVQSATSELAAD